MRLTRGGELGCALGRALGCDCSSGTKTGNGFRAALGRAVGRAFAVLRCPGRTPQPASPKNWGGLKKALGRRANSAIPKGIAGLGRSDALAARGRRAENECHGMGL